MKNILQKASALALMAFAFIGAYAQQAERPKVTVPSVSIAPGEEKTVAIYLDDNPDDKICQFQTTVTLPAGFEFVKKGNTYAQKGKRSTNHIAMASKVANSDNLQSYKIGLVSGTNAAIKADKDSSLLEFTIKAPSTLENAVYVINLTNITIAGKIGVQYKGTSSRPYTAKGLALNSNVDQVSFGFSVPDTLNVNPGQNVTIDLNSTWPSTFSIRALEAHVTLPEGLSFVTNEDGAITFNNARYPEGEIMAGQSLLKNDKNANMVIGALGGTIATTPESLGSITIKADSAFTGYKVIKATYMYDDKKIGLASQGEVRLYVGCVVEAPTFELSPDTLKLAEGDTADVSVKIKVPEGTKPTVNGAITLPEGLTFAEGDGTFTVPALAADSTVNVKVVAGKAFEGSKEIVAVLNATSESGYAFDALKDTIAVKVEAPKAPEFAFAEKDTLKLDEGADAAIVVNLTLPEGTELSGITGKVSLPTGVSFNRFEQGVALNDEDGDVNTNGNTAKFTITKAGNGALLTINITGNKGFKDGVVKLEFEATSKAGTAFDKIVIERVVVNQTATGINTIRTDAEKLDGARYNLSGQKVSENYKGIVIVNGKKVIIK